MRLKYIFTFISIAGAFTANAQQVLHAKDVQLVTTPGTQLVLQGGIKFTGSTTRTDSATTTLLPDPVTGTADWTDSTAAGVFVTNTGKTVFNNPGSKQEIIGRSAFYDLRVNGKGVNLHQSNEVKNILSLDTGLVYFQSPADSIFISNPAFAAVNSTSAYSRSWINGKLRRNINTAGTGNANEYLFPVGKISGPDSLYAPVKIQKSTAVQNSYTVQYIPGLPYDAANIQKPPIDHISQVESWEITATQPTGTDAEAKIALSWRGYSRVSASQTNRDSLLVVQYLLNPSGRWEKAGPSTLHEVSNPSDSLGGWVKHRDFLANYDFAQRRFTLGTASKLNVVPLQLLWFTALADGDKVRLNWQISNDQDIAVYETQQSTDGNNFHHLNNVTSLQKNSWTYTDYDKNPVNGWNYYRLKIFDRSGRFTYSEIRKVNFSKGTENISIFPNPVVTTLNIQLPTAYSNNVVLELYAADGKRLSSLQPKESTVQLNVSTLPSGTYYIKAIRKDQSQTLKFIKVQP